MKPVRDCQASDRDCQAAPVRQWHASPLPCLLELLYGVIEREQLLEEVVVLVDEAEQLRLEEVQLGLEVLAADAGVVDAVITVEDCQVVLVVEAEVSAGAGRAWAFGRGGGLGSGGGGGAPFLGYVLGGGQSLLVELPDVPETVDTLNTSTRRNINLGSASDKVTLDADTKMLSWMQLTGQDKLKAVADST